MPRFLEARTSAPLGFREGGADKALQTAFGIAVRERVGQLFDGWRLEDAGDKQHHARLYRLVRAPGPATKAPDAATDRDGE